MPAPRLIKQIADPSWFGNGVYFLMGVPFLFGLLGALIGALIADAVAGLAIGLCIGLAAWCALNIWAVRVVRRDGYKGRRRT
jgi:hypothetical protein